MIVISDIKEMQRFSKAQRSAGKSIAVVPTMGALHRGHLSLIQLAKEKADITVLTIFVNPTQFDNDNDLEHYPRTFEQDKTLCEQHGLEVLFIPHVADVYAPDFSTWVNEEQLSDGLCGASREGHFQGVTTVVSKLFNMVLPDVAIFGQKDAQQAMVIKRLVRDLNFPIEVVIAPTVREPSGLALSSRNKHLSDSERQEAAIIHKTLNYAKVLCFEHKAENLEIVRQFIIDEIETTSGKVDYVNIVRQHDLKCGLIFDQPIIIAVAVFFGKTRLIDNIFIDNE